MEANLKAQFFIVKSTLKLDNNIFLVAATNSFTSFTQSGDYSQEFFYLFTIKCESFLTVKFWVSLTNGSRLNIS